jgi:hypothetical protein
LKTTKYTFTESLGQMRDEINPYDFFASNAEKE